MNKIVFFFLLLKQIFTYSDIIHLQKLNDTHFACDGNLTVLDLSKINDDYCDCEDGSDENSKYCGLYRNQRLHKRKVLLL